MWIDQDQPCENKSYYKMHRITNFGTHPLAKLKSLVRLNTHAKGEKIKSKTQLASTHDWRVHILICWVDLQICKSSNQFIANGTSFDVLQFISDSCIAAWNKFCIWRRHLWIIPFTKSINYSSWVRGKWWHHLLAFEGKFHLQCYPSSYMWWNSSPHNYKYTLDVSPSNDNALIRKVAKCSHIIKFVI